MKATPPTSAESPAPNPGGRLRPDALRSPGALASTPETTLVTLDVAFADSDAREAAEALLGVIPGDLQDPEAILQGVRTLLHQRMTTLLAGPRAGLMHALYRFDVEERRVRDVFSQVHPEHLAAALSEEVLRRALQKIAARRRWAGHFDVS
jgi:hypothetical protein